MPQLLSQNHLVHIIQWSSNLGSTCTLRESKLHAEFILKQ